MKAAHYSSFTIYRDLNLVICNFQGEATVNDVIKLNRAILADKNFHPDLNLVFDFTGCRALGYKFEVQEYIDFFKNTIQLKNKVKVGVLYITPNQRFLLTVYKKLGKLIKHDVEIFRTMDEYIEWMEFNQSEALQIKEKLESIKSFSPDLMLFE